MSALRFRGLSTVALLTLLSRVMGLARDAGMAVLFGAGPLLDAFSLAFRLPNLARRLFGEGALTTAFLPVFVRTYQDDADLGRRVAWSTTRWLASVLAASVLVVELGVALAAPYASADVGVLLELIAWLFPYVLFVCVAAQLSAVLHGRDHFFWPAALPVVLNGFWLAALVLAPVWFDDRFNQMRFVAGSIAVAGLVQCVLAERATSAVGVGYRPASRDPHPEATRSSVREVLRTMIPTLFGLTITQVNVIVDSVLAWGFSPSSGISAGYQLVEEGTATALYLGQRLFQFPLGVFGVALGTVLFPVLAKHAAANDRTALSRDLTSGLQLCVCIGLPASMGLILLAPNIPRVMFEYGSFDANDSLLTAKMIAAYGLAVWAMIGLLIVNRAFYAVGDPQTPLRAGLWAVVVNTGLNAILLVPLGGVGLALATSIASIVQLIYTIRILSGSIVDIDWRALSRTAAKTAAATLAMAAAIELCHQAMGERGRYLELAVPFAIGVATYVLAARVLRLSELFSLLQRAPEE